MSFSNLLDNYIFTNNYLHKLLNYEYQKNLSLPVNEKIFFNNGINYDDLINKKNNFNENTENGINMTYSSNNYTKKLTGTDLGFSILNEYSTSLGYANILISTPNKLFGNSFAHLYSNYLVTDVIPDENNSVNRDAIWYYSGNSCASEYSLKSTKTNISSYQWIAVNDGYNIKIFLYASNTTYNTTHNGISESKYPNENVTKLIYINVSLNKIINNIPMQKSINSITKGIEKTSEDSFISAIDKSNELKTFSYDKFIHVKTENNHLGDAIASYQTNQVNFSYNEENKINDIPESSLIDYENNYCREYEYDSSNQKFKNVYNYLSDCQIKLQVIKNTKLIFPLYFIRSAGYFENDKNTTFKNSSYFDVSKKINDSYYPNGDPTSFPPASSNNFLPLVIILNILLLLLIFV